MDTHPKNQPPPKNVLEKRQRKILEMILLELFDSRKNPIFVGLLFRVNPEDGEGPTKKNTYFWESFQRQFHLAGTKA